MSEWLADGDHRSGRLAFADKAATQAQSRHDQRQCQCNLLHGTPHRVIRPGYTDMGPPLAIVPKSHSAYEYAGGGHALNPSKIRSKICNGWQGAGHWKCSLFRPLEAGPAGQAADGRRQMCGTAVDPGVGVDEKCRRRGVACQNRAPGAQRRASRWTMYETVGWVIAVSVVALLALHVLLVLGVMSAIQLRDAFSRERQSSGGVDPER